MNFELSGNDISKISGDVALVFAFEDKKGYVPTKTLTSLDKTLKGAVIDALSFENFKGKSGQTVSIHTNGAILAKKITVVGLGKKDELTKSELRKIIAGIVKGLSSKVNSIVLSVISDKLDFAEAEQIQMIAEGVLLGNYKFSEYKKKEKEDKVLEAVVLSGVTSQKELQKAVDMAETIFQATRLARDLVNQPAVIATPTYLAKIAQDIAKANPEITCKVFDRAACEKMGMGAFLGVARGSDTPPKFVHLHYKPKKSTSKRKLAIIGKAITFDSGGFSLKPDKFMTTMKCDMSGAAAVLGLFSVISELKPDFEVMGIFAATPNLISGSAYVPGDVLRAMNGKTIEVINTDAEGRVTLADGLSYAVKQGATEIVDLATLTGAAMVALGTDYTALFTNNEKFGKVIKDAFAASGEKVWEMPLPREYAELNKSDIADIANLSPGYWAGAITAALFLKEFVDEKPWVHLDIAGPAFAEQEYELGPKGGTGYGVSTLIHLVKGGNE